MITAGGCVQPLPFGCDGLETRPHGLDVLTSQSRWHIFKCKRGDNVWHVNGPARSWDGSIFGMNIDYSCGAEALEAFDKGWADTAPYIPPKKVVAQ